MRHKTLFYALALITILLCTGLAFLAANYELPRANASGLNKCQRQIIVSYRKTYTQYITMDWYNEMFRFFFVLVFLNDTFLCSLCSSSWLAIDSIWTWYERKVVDDFCFFLSYCTFVCSLNHAPVQVMQRSSKRHMIGAPLTYTRRSVIFYR